MICGGCRNLTFDLALGDEEGVGINQRFLEQRIAPAAGNILVCIDLG